MLLERHPLLLHGVQRHGLGAARVGPAQHAAVDEGGDAMLHEEAMAVLAVAHGLAPSQP